MVYLVEDQTAAEPKAHIHYWAHVYVSVQRARAGVEHFAERGGHGPLRWKCHSSVSYAYSVADGRELYRVVPLHVRLDKHPEP
ncbi:hypothetical protein ACIBG7_26645 [Nonomuraea sp. NPDC050328]|uniref:hypothetical protein n=1 Tax=Nonomuraea sp. NPDC050328 TaxID=3364361 RepID=UPI0037AE6052